QGNGRTPAGGGDRARSSPRRPPAQPARTGPEHPLAAGSPSLPRLVEEDDSNGRRREDAGESDDAAGPGTTAVVAPLRGAGRPGPDRRRVRRSAPAR